MAATVRNFASELAGASLAGGWRVVAIIPRSAHATGGSFSVQYQVENAEGHAAFLKAIDLTAARSFPDVFRALEGILRAYNYERDLVRRCASAKTDRIVTIWDSGQVEIEPGNPFSLVPYLIFEMADGDIHKHIDFSRGVDIAFAARTLHEVSIGLSQLHQLSIAHQDVKPSNVVVFPGAGAKLGDLGRASSQGVPIDHDHAPWAGDAKYTPPELLYGAGSTSDWATRRVGCDAYMFGALAVFLMTGLCVSAEIQQRLPPALRRDVFRGSYPDVLPFIVQATNELILEVEASIPHEIRSGIGAMIRSLCEPDPAKRGHPAQRKQKHGNPYDLRRYTSELDIIRRRAEASVLRARSAP